MSGLRDGVATRGRILLQTRGEGDRKKEKASAVRQGGDRLLGGHRAVRRREAAGRLGVAHTHYLGTTSRSVEASVTKMPTH